MIAKAPYRNTEPVTLRRCNHCRQRYEFTRSTSRYCSARCRVAANRKAARRSVHFRSDTCEWATPQDLFDELDAEFHFGLDVCATSDNAKCGRYFTRHDNGLQQEWLGVCWCNPPYGRTIGQWVQKAAAAAASGSTVVCLLPARTDTAWWQDIVARHEVRFLRGRVKFGGSENSAPFPSAVVVMRPSRSNGTDTNTSIPHR